MGHLASTGYSLSMEFLPKLHTLVLTNNQLTNLVEIDPLASLPKLQFLSLLDNNITKKPNYRLYVIHKLKSLRLLDFKRVKHEEQIEAKNLFSSEEDEEQAKKEFAKTFVPGEAPSIPEDPKEEQAPKPVAPTPEQIITIKVSSTLYLFSLFLLVHRFHIFNELRLNPKLEW
ncbi:U2 small nuclear ribonucleoprotein A'-like isoform X1 [Camellia sinensis]|uniref:U2 small nuclear ribonucleoprotein A'-like isoform X1 n=1 Tax=Camellia sinensis TaxID=4442 RepID=UPI001036D94A|nr:U2 small nuclear ribonucleoprotein A'-like isoform X1 [Camellia sinensis]XP_028077728.1 U2 small nuclear ribonucleoprotein A'-like isoform X1 [Camellia sinensis]XP_028077729.1 U2 small nuclear ribonucleoprotein A'-like isoform X1 [Camellia sinensis]XP_028077730.1 U2 small nuclear ribonucleoprotein A'-like isoform X1 [Camellia sinensis]